MRMTHILCVFLTAILTVAFLDPSEAANPHGGGAGSWTQVIHDDHGQIAAASGRDPWNIPLALTVATMWRDGILTRSTTYVRGGRAVRIDRVYDAAGGVEITYHGEGERLIFSLQRDAATGEALAIYTFPDGRMYMLWIDERGRVLSGDLAGLRLALSGENGLLGSLHHYARDTEELADTISEGGKLFQLRWPDQGCVDACSIGCDSQCAWECSLFPVSCGVCRTSCALGCFIGCAGS